MAQMMYTVLGWMLLAGLAAGKASPRGFENCMFDAGTLTFITMASDNIHHLPNPVKIHGVAPAASIIARTPSPPGPGEMDPYMPPSTTNFSIYLTHDKQFDLCFFLNLNVPSYPEAPDFRVMVPEGAVVVENQDFKRLQQKMEETQQRMEDGDLPSLAELNEPPQDFYPLKEMSQRCVRASLYGSEYLVNVQAQVDYPLRLFGSPVPLMDLTVVTESNRDNVTEIVNNMKDNMERGIEMVRNYGAPRPPMPPMPPMMPHTMPFGPAPPAPPPGVFPGPFHGRPRPENNNNAADNDNNRFENRNPQQGAASQTPNAQWRPSPSLDSRTRQGWMAGNNMPMRTFRGQQ